eukprot:3764917-Rhodomonas_salina.2
MVLLGAALRATAATYLSTSMILCRSPSVPTHGRVSVEYYTQHGTRGTCVSVVRCHTVPMCCTMLPKPQPGTYVFHSATRSLVLTNALQHDQHQSACIDLAAASAPPDSEIKHAKCICGTHLWDIKHTITHLWYQLGLCPDSGARESKVSLDGQHFSARTQARVVNDDIFELISLSGILGARGGLGENAIDLADELLGYTGGYLQFYGVRQALTFGENVWGNLGHADTPFVDCQTCSPVPYPIDALAGKEVASLAMGRTFGLAVAYETFGDQPNTRPIAGRLYTWGDNYVGQLGTGGYLGYTLPRAVRSCCRYLLSIGGVRECVRRMDEETFAGSAAGVFHSMAWTAEGTLYVWGWNALGQLGLGALVLSLRVLRDVSGTDLCVCYAVSGTDLYACYGVSGPDLCACYGVSGTDLSHQVLAPTVPEPTPMGTLEGLGEKVVQATGGYSHTLIRTASGRIYAAGANNKVYSPTRLLRDVRY